jgi:hypothetical protein
MLEKTTVHIISEKKTFIRSVLPINTTQQIFFYYLTTDIYTKFNPKQKLEIHKK